MSHRTHVRRREAPRPRRGSRWFPVACAAHILIPQRPELDSGTPLLRPTMHWKVNLGTAALALGSLLGSAQAQVQKGEEPAVTMSTEAVATDGVAGYTTYQVKVTFGPKAQDVYALVSDVQCFLSTSLCFLVIQTDPAAACDASMASLLMLLISRQLAKWLLHSAPTLGRPTRLSGPSCLNVRCEHSITYVLRH